MPLPQTATSPQQRVQEELALLRRLSVARRRASFRLLLDDQRQNSASRMMTGMGTPSSQSRMERPIGDLHKVGG